jgi:beta-lactamase regulating signal transducer with metallopeptidase domain
MSFSLPFLLDLSLRGSLVVLAASIADLVWAGKITARWRRVWWLIVPFAFLWPGSMMPPVWICNFGLNGVYSSPISHVQTPTHSGYNLIVPVQIPVGLFAGAAFSWLPWVWLAGVIGSTLLVIIPTWKVQRQWSTKRLSTDPVLLNLLEDAKITAGITAPIGLIVTDEIAAPALLGWLRPRILLPTFLSTGSPNELRAVLLHELAHFKSLDIPLNWLFTAVRVIHWFNPLAWLASAAWTRFREEAADENAIRWMHEPTGTAYGEILLKTLGKCTGGPAPYGALAIGESIENLKRRILMIRNYHSKSSRGWMASAVIFTLGALMALSPTLAGDDDQDAAEKEAVAAIQAWLGEMDAGSYARSWTDAAKIFRDAVPSDKWVTLSQNVRTPLGKLIQRNLDSAAYQSGVLSADPNADKGTYVIAQFDTSFENMKYARESVTVEKEADGVWRAAGYYIKPQ